MASKLRAETALPRLGWRARRHFQGRGWLLAGALLYLGVLLLPTQAHERYAFPAVPLLAGAATAPGKSTKVAWRGAALYGMITGAHLLNLAWAAPFSPTVEATFAGRVGSGIAIALLMCALALGGWYSLRQAGKSTVPLQAEGSAHA